MLVRFCRMHSTSPFSTSKLPISTSPDFLRTRIPSLKSFLFHLQNSPAISIPQLHAKIFKTQFFNDVFVLTRVAHAYLRSGQLTAAKRVLFSSFSATPPIFLWNETIKAYARRGLFRESIQIYESMIGSGVRPNAFTFTFVVPACGGLRSVDDGNRVHEDAERLDCVNNVFVATALVDMYAKCGEIVLAKKVFDGMPHRGTASFNAMIAGYVLNDKSDEAISLFKKMLISGVTYDALTLVAVLQACASVGALYQGRWIHEQIVQAHMQNNMYLCAALISMYARCGSMEESRRVFDETPVKDLISWTAVICGYGMHGLAQDAESLFLRMVESRIQPDSVTFVGLLSGFGHKGMVEDGRKYFKVMTELYNINPTIEHYSCMVDMLGRAGKLEEAEKFISEMTVKPDAGVWGGLLNACKIHTNVGIGERVINEVLKIDPSNAGWYVLMSNIYASAKKWDGVARMRVMMKEKNVLKPPGWSLVEIGGRRHRFVAFDRSHPMSDEIYKFLRDLEERMQVEGYIANTKSVMANLDEEAKVDMLCGHSERLAIAFGILNTKDGDVVRVIKNLRACVDCHNATKFISKIARREIIVRDAKRFHHFKDGLCSCGDYW